MNNPNFKNYQYKTDLFIVSSDDKVISLNSGNPSVTVFNYFQNSVFPIIKIDLLLNKVNLRILQEDFDNIKLLLSVYKIESSDTEIADNPKSGILNTIDTSIKNSYLKIFDINRTPVIPPNENAKNEHFEQVEESPVTLFCFISSHLESNKLQLPFIFNNVTIQDVIVALSTKHQISKILLSPVENTKVYQQIVIPPLNYTNSIYYLHEIYGIYKTGVSLYMDFEYTYILKNDFRGQLPHHSNFPYNFEKVIFDIHPLNENLFNYDSIVKVDNTSKTFIIECKNNFSIKNSEITIKETGEIFKFVTNNPRDQNHNQHEILDNFKSLSNPESPVKAGNTPKEVIKWNKYSNDFKISEYQFNLKNSMFQISRIFSNCDMEIFTPNRKYILNFLKDPTMEKYAGQYKIDSFMFTIKGKSADLQNSIGVISLSKVDSDYT